MESNARKDLRLCSTSSGTPVSAVGDTVGFPPAPFGEPLRGELPISKNSLTVLRRRYLRRDDSGNPLEAPEDLFRRVAENLASVDADFAWRGRTDPDATAREFYALMTEFRFQPNSPTLMNAGRELQQLSACFVLPVDDSMEGIFDAIKNTAIIHKSGGGTGFAFSRLRSRGSVVRSTSGVASGPVSFMKVFNAATEAVKQGGTRRGANMGILRVDHPDIEDFILCKKDPREVTNFNISVAVTDRFMDALQADGDYELIDPHTKTVVGTRSARRIFDMLCDGAWRNGDPGVVFIDRINAKDPVTPVIGEIEATNPCGEQPLHPGDSCNLGSINLAKHLRRDVSGAGAARLDWDALRDTVHESVHFLDNVIEANHYPLLLIHEISHANRKIGLGVMGWADLLVALGISYTSQQAIDLAEEVMAFIQREGHEASRQLARDRGAFPNWTGSRPEHAGEPPRRNSTVTTIAPTGTISIIADCSSGIEPLFAVAFVRNQAGVKMTEVNPYFVKVARERGFYSEELMERVAREGSVQGIPEVPDDVKRVFVVSHDIRPEWHVRMQAAFQKYTDNAVSKTVNFPNEATVDDVRQVYVLAWDLGCKGVTVYRDGSREGQVLSTGNTEKKHAAESGAGAAAAAPDRPADDPGVAAAHSALPVIASTPIAPRARPVLTTGTTERVLTGCGNLYVTINQDERGPVELFSSLGKSGGCASAQTQAISRLISLCLRAGVEMPSIVKHLRGIRCHNPALDSGQWVLSCPDAIGISLEHHMDLGAEPGAFARDAADSFGASPGEIAAAAPDALVNPSPAVAAMAAMAAASAGAGARVVASTRPSGGNGSARTATLDSLHQWIGACPECGSAVEHESGCVTCRFCGYSKCS